MKIERETNKYEIDNFMISMKYYIANRRERYVISRDTSKKENMLYIYAWRLRERQSYMRLAISRYQWNIISPKDEDDISYHEIHPKQQKQFIYIYISENEDWERDNQIWDWQYDDINEILHRQKEKEDYISYHEIHSKQQKGYIYIYKWRLKERQINMRLAISRYQRIIISPEEDFDISYHEIHPEKKEIYIYMKMKIERETIKYEIGNFKISMKYYIAKRRRRYFITWDTS